MFASRMEATVCVPAAVLVRPRRSARATGTAWSATLRRQTNSAEEWALADEPLASTI